MRVLSVYKTYFPDPPGGLQEAIRQICLATTREGIENTIFTLTPTLNPKCIEFPEARVVREKSWWAPASCDLSGLASVKTYTQLARQADLIHFFYPWPFADALNLLVRSKKPKVLTYISDIVQQKFLNRAYAPLMWHTLHQMDVIVANCEAYARTSPILSHPSIRNKVKIIPLGMDDASDLTKPTSHGLEKFGLSREQPYFLFIGVHRYYKGLHTLIEASLACDAKIVIAGTGPKTPELIAQAKRLGAHHVEFIGQVSDADKMALIAGCRALVLPSHLRSEAYGMVLVEASMLGKPMITCEIGTGTSFVNLNGTTGIVIEPESPSALAAAMKALTEDHQLAIKLGAQAKARYAQLFSGPVLGQAYSELYRSLLRS